MEREADVVVIGGGITGTAILAALSRYELSCVLLEKEPDIAAGTTKANSAILHAGFDAPTGSLKAKMNVEGNRLYHELYERLGLEMDIKWTGSLVAAVTDEDVETLKELKARGDANGVPGLEIWDGDRAREQEPNLSPAVKAALWAPTAGICWPFGLAQGFAEIAVMNGAEIIRECPVTGIETVDGKIMAVETPQGKIKAKLVINAAGVQSDEISKMAGDDSFRIIPRRGEYVLFDKTVQGSLVNGVVFPTPTKTSKGILVCATTHGNVFVGPNAVEQDDKEDTSVTPAGMDEIMNGARKLVENIPGFAAITEFAGIRAVSSTGDFVLGESAKTAGLIQAAGIQSPGLTSAPAIAEYLAAIVVEKLGAAAKKNYTEGRPPVVLRELPREEQAKLIAENPLYGRVICRCETITEGEIVDAIRRPCGARTVDGVKRRTRAGMGRCQGGFCGPRVVQLLSRELGIPVSEVRKDGKDSYLYYNKENGGQAE